MFSEPTGSGVTEPGAVLIQGDATVEDRVVTDMMADPDLAELMETVFARQPAGAFMSSWLGRRLLPFLLHAHPDLRDTAARSISGRPAISSSVPQELDLRELHRVG